MNDNVAEGRGGPVDLARRRWLLITVALPLLGGCKIALPFRGPAADPEQAAGETVVLALTHVTLGADRAKNAVFWRHTGQVLEAVAKQAGYLGHTARRELFGNEGWTMTVWRDEASLRGFVQSDVHQAAIRNGLPAVTGARFANLKLPRREVPISWEAAERILREQGRGY